MLADAELKFWSIYVNSVLLHLDLPFGGKIHHTIMKNYLGVAALQASFSLVLFEGTVPYFWQRANFLFNFCLNIRQCQTDNTFIIVKCFIMWLIKKAQTNTS